jgi:chromosome segregation ATPase
MDFPLSRSGQLNSTSSTEETYMSEVDKLKERGVALKQLLDMVTDQRNLAEAERNALNAKLIDKISEIISLKKQVEELTQENSDLRDSLQIAIYG